MNLLRAASLVSLLTLLSRVTGLVREQLLASLFGASAWTDAYQVAFRIPNLLRRLFAEGAFSQAFVPLLAQSRAREGDEATARLIDAVATVLFWALLVICVMGVAASPVLVWIMASGLAKFDGAVLMTRWMFPYIGCMSLVALSAGILNTWRHFAVPAVTPVLLNLAVIASAWWLSPWFTRWGLEPIYALAAGVMMGGLLQLAVQVPALLRVACFPRIGLAPRAIGAAWQHPGVGRVLKQMAPALLGVSVAQLSLLINTQIASHAGEGAVSWLTYADRLMEFPTGLLGVALGVVLLPQLSAADAKSDAATYSSLLDWGLRLTLLLALPCAVALLVFPTALVAGLYHYGAFTALDVAKTVSALQGYGIGLLGLIAVKILAPGFYARQDIRTPVKIAITVLGCTQMMNLLLVPHWGFAGLAWSIGFGALLNAGWLFIGLRRAGLYSPAPGWARFALQVVSATTLLCAVLVAASHYIDWIHLQEHSWLRLAMLFGALAAAAMVYGAALWLLGVRPQQFRREANAYTHRN
jgi:putative peptidoglycan lipid II flippase